VDGSAAVELNDLVSGVESTTTVDVRGSAGLLEGDSILTDIGPPTVLC
jgi:hypothetical protein